MYGPPWTRLLLGIEFSRCEYRRRLGISVVTSQGVNAGCWGVPISLAISVLHLDRRFTKAGRRIIDFCWTVSSVAHPRSRLFFSIHSSAEYVLITVSRGAWCLGASWYRPSCICFAKQQSLRLLATTYFTPSPPPPPPPTITSGGHGHALLSGVLIREIGPTTSALVPSTHSYLSMPSSVPIVESSLNDRHVVLSGTSRFPVSTAVTDPITYRPAVRLFNRQENPCVSCRQLNEDVSSQYSFQQRSVPRSLPSLLTPNVLDSPFSSHLARCNQLFTPIPISVPDHSPLNLEDTILPGERVAVRGRAHYSSQRYEVSFPDSGMPFTRFGIQYLAFTRSTYLRRRLSKCRDIVGHSKESIAHSPWRSSNVI